MRRLALLGLAVLALGAAPAESATKEYSTENINVRIGSHMEEPLTVPDTGPVSFLRVSFRITTPEESALSISLVSPKGTAVPLVAHRGAGADFGSGEKGCGGIPIEFDSDTTSNPIAAETSPRRRPDARPPQLGVRLVTMKRSIDSLLEAARSSITRLSPRETYAAWQEVYRSSSGGSIPSRARHV